MDSQNHWEKIYTEKAPTAVSWYRPHLETSVSLIERVATKESAIIDVGGGESTLVDDLLSHGYNNITVLDISRRAIDENIKRLGVASERAHWLVADITKAELRESIYDVWHDRAVFHFLTQQSDRIAYVGQAARAVKAGGHVIVSTFGPEGPTKCSGLDSSKASKNCTRRRLEQSSSSSTAIARSNRSNRGNGGFLALRTNGFT
jgi:2-polyprenyl-3-methyl-5-hydroxy-6-metoxy-1,4-benzoquinol methylase